jgi:fumarate hydratase class II
MTSIRKETDSLGEVDVAADKLWGAQTQRSLEHFSIGKDLIPREMIAAYAILKKAAANANLAGKRLDNQRHKLIVQVCDEILAGRHQDMFPLHVWMTGSGTQFNMNVNEVISNRCCQLAGTPLGSKSPVHPNDHINMSQSSNDSFPSAMDIAAAVNVKQRLIPAVKALQDAIAARARLVDHAGQSEPDPGRGAHDDRRPSDGERRGSGLRRRRRLPRDERLQAPDHLQRCPLHHDHNGRLHELPQIPGRRDEAES